MVLKMTFPFKNSNLQWNHSASPTKTFPQDKIYVVKETFKQQRRTRFLSTQRSNQDDQERFGIFSSKRSNKVFELILVLKWETKLYIKQELQILDNQWADLFLVKTILIIKWAFEEVSWQVGLAISRLQVLSVVVYSNHLLSQLDNYLIDNQLLGRFSQQ